jgi:signal transduction histidine kinase
MKEMLEDSVGVAKCLNNIGNIYAWQADFARALQYHMRSLSIKERVGDKATIAPSLTNIGNIYHDFGNPDKALEYYMRGLRLNEELGNPRSISFSLESIGSVYEDKGDHEVALTYYRRALGVLEPIGEKQRIGICNRRIGMVLKKQGDYERALLHYGRAIEIQEDMEDRAGLTVTLREIGDIKRELEAYDEASDYIEQSSRIAREGNLRRELMKSYQTQAHLLEDKGGYGKALAALKRYDTLKDSLFNEETSERIAEMQIRYDTERQEREIDVLTSERQIQLLALNKQKSFRNYLILCSLLTLILGALIYSRYALKRRSNELLEGKNTELELTNRQLTKSEEDLRMLNAMKDRFFSIIAHDLKSPMNAFLELSEMLAHNAETLDRRDIEEAINAINETAMKLFTLLENLLQWARMQTGSMPFNPQNVTIALLLQKDVGLLNAHAERKGIELAIDIDDDTRVYADASMTSAILRNLLSNAIKFTTRGGEVRVESRRRGCFIELSVKDTGVGIRNEDRARLFRIDVHHSTVGTAEEGGTGLGLILCKEFVEKHGGEIWVESSEGRGSIFRFTLPVVT